MLSQINISNLDNSISNTSIYSDACQNSMELEELYQKKNNLKKTESNNNDNNDNEKQSSNKKSKENENENENINPYVNKLSNLSKSEMYESFDEEQINIGNKNKDKKEDNRNIYENQNVINNNINYLNNKIVGKNESIDIFHYKNDSLRFIYDSQNEFKKNNSINKIINNKNINNVNLSNINIIINKGENHFSEKIKKEKSNINLTSIEEKNKINDLSDKSSLSSYMSTNKQKKGKKIIIKSINDNYDDDLQNKEEKNNEKNIKIINNNETKNENENENENSNIKNETNINNKTSNNINESEEGEELNKNLNINELAEINNNNIIKSKNKDKDKDNNNENDNDKLNESNIKIKKKKSINTLSSNLELNSDFDNVTIITKIKKRQKKNSNNSISKSINTYNDNSSFFSNSSLLVNSVKFEGIGNNEIDLDFLKSLRTIPIKYKKKSKKKYLKTLLELQNFFIDDIAISVMKISEDGQNLSVGLVSGKIKLFEIIGYDYNKFESSYDKDNYLNYLNFIKEKPFKTLNGHTQEIIDLSWSSFFPNLLLSGSLDNVILWDIIQLDEKCRIESFEHYKMITCISFSPTDRYKFVSGCMDKFVRIWDFKNVLIMSNSHNNSNNNNNSNININNDIQSLDKNLSQNSLNINKLKKYNILYFNIEEKITSISFFPTGDKLAIGTHNGKIIIYEIKGNKFYYKSSFSCRNRIGKNSLGKKITSIDFFNKNEALISSCDSRLRLISMSDGKIIHKYKGYLNENSMIRASIDYNYDAIITGSEDGNCYVWNIDNDEKKNLNYEYFKPYSQEEVLCSLIVPEKCYCNFLKKIMKITDKLIVTSIIINATNKGRLEILLNIDEK